MSYIDVTGKTEEEAISRALDQLGMDRDDVSVEILERAKSGFLGIGSTPAKVRVTYGPAEEEIPVRQETSVKPPEKKPGVPEAVKAQPVPRKEPVSAKAPVPVKEPAPVKKEAPVKAEAPAPVKTEVPAGEEVNDEKAAAIREFLSGLLEKMDIPAVIRVYLPEKGRYQVILDGENMGQIIGRRGETLDAIQQLTSYCVNRSGTGRVRVQLDTENYRAKREESLEHLAKKVAVKVVKYRRSVTLEPMNAYERHIIHTALQDVEHVTTFSTGTEPNRRVIVSYEKDRK